jgi:putative (di)nucleoside polyphosphate hydrolase
VGADAEREGHRAGADIGRDQAPAGALTVAKARAKLPYRRAVGIMLLDAHNRVLVCQRADPVGPAWQMPQGGIDKGELPRAAALRELAEEVGTAKVEIIGETPGWLAYDLPPAIQRNVWGGRYRGQKQKWFAMRFLGRDRDIRLDAHREPEFTAWRWLDADELPALTVAFKRAVYRDVLKAFRRLVTPPKARRQPAPGSGRGRGRATTRRA